MLQGSLPCTVTYSLAPLVLFDVLQVFLRCRDALSVPLTHGPWLSIVHILDLTKARSDDCLPRRPRRLARLMRRLRRAKLTLRSRVVSKAASVPYVIVLKA